MSEPTKQARQRCADLAANELCDNRLTKGEMYERAFARHVQQTIDTMREIVEHMGDLRAHYEIPKPSDSGGVIETLARPFILPDEVDPDLIEARECAALAAEKRGLEGLAEKLRAGLEDQHWAVPSALIAIKRRQA